MSSDEQMQRDVASIALGSAGSAGFALAGSGAIREHGLTHRHYLDVDAIRGSGRFTDAQLVVLASNADPGFDIHMFAQRLQEAERIQLREVSVYGVDQSDLAGVVERSHGWARRLTDSPTPGASERDLQAEQSNGQTI